MEALSLALFVECFIGERVGSAVSGGFVMYSGQAIYHQSAAFHVQMKFIKIE